MLARSPSVSLRAASSQRAPARSPRDLHSARRPL